MALPSKDVNSTHCEIPIKTEFGCGVDIEADKRSGTDMAQATPTSMEEMIDEESAKLQGTPEASESYALAAANQVITTTDQGSGVGNMSLTSTNQTTISSIQTVHFEDAFMDQRFDDPLNVIPSTIDPVSTNQIASSEDQDVASVDQVPPSPSEMLNSHDQDATDRYFDDLMIAMNVANQSPDTHAQVLNCNDQSTVDSSFDSIALPDAANLTPASPAQISNSNDQNAIDRLPDSITLPEVANETQASPAQILDSNNQSAVDLLFDSVTLLEVENETQASPAQILHSNDQSAVDRLFDSITLPEAANETPASPAQIVESNNQNAVDRLFDSITLPESANETPAPPAQILDSNDQSAVDQLFDSITLPDAANQKPGVPFYTPPLPVAQLAGIEYLELVARALLSHGRPMLVADIYEWIINNFPSKTATRSWQNSVRHVLTTMSYFYKDSHSSYGKAHYWWIQARYLKCFQLGHFKKRDIEDFIEKSEKSPNQASSIRYHPYMHSTPADKQEKSRRTLHTVSASTALQGVDQHANASHLAPSQSSMPSPSGEHAQGGRQQPSAWNSVHSGYVSGNLQSALGNPPTHHGTGVQSPHTHDRAHFWQYPSANYVPHQFNNSPWVYGGHHDQTCPQNPTPYHQMQHQPWMMPQDAHCLQQAVQNLQQISHGQMPQHHNQMQKLHMSQNQPQGHYGEQ